MSESSKGTGAGRVMWCHVHWECKEQRSTQNNLTFNILTGVRHQVPKERDKKLGKDVILQQRQLSHHDDYHCATVNSLPPSFYLSSLCL